MSGAEPALVETPFVSLVLPIRNEQTYIRGCLERLLAQDYPARSLEILVVDGASTDETRSVVRAVMDEHPHRAIRLLDNPEKIVPTALNIGIRESRGDVVIRMDGHTVPAQDYVTACVRALHESGADNVGGRIEPHGTSTFGKAVAAAQAHPAGAGDAKFHYANQPAFVDTVYMGAFRKDVFDRAGMFDEAMIRNQDYEMNVRIRKSGGRVYLDPKIRSSYAPRETVGALWSQYFQYGWWRMETLRRHPDSLRWRQTLPPVFVGSLAVLAVAAPAFVWARVLIAVQLATYLAFLTAASIHARDKLRSPRTMVAWFPVAVAVMHVAWGTGFLLNLSSGGRVPRYRRRARSEP